MRTTAMHVALVCNEVTFTGDATALGLFHCAGDIVIKMQIAKDTQGLKEGVTSLQSQIAHQTAQKKVLVM